MKMKDFVRNLYALACNNQRQIGEWVVPPYDEVTKALGEDNLNNFLLSHYAKDVVDFKHTFPPGAGNKLVINVLNLSSKIANEDRDKSIARRDWAAVVVSVIGVGVIIVQIIQAITTVP